MTDENAEISTIAPSIKGAMRRARLEEAERSDVIAELRGAELARLEMLAEKLEPVYAQLPDDVDMFDAGVIPGERPRLFVDMIGFVEMGNDKRTYRFIQDTRHGRVTVKESDRTETMVHAITDYIGRRMLERERAMASDQTVEDAARALVSDLGRKTGGSPDAAGKQPQPAAISGAQTAKQPDAAQEPTPQAARDDKAENGAHQKRKTPAVDTLAADAAPPRRGFMAWLWDAIEFLALFIGFVVMLVGIAGAVYFAWKMGDAGVFSGFFKTG